jgi:hypothetical protein
MQRLQVELPVLGTASGVAELTSEDDSCSCSIVLDSRSMQMNLLSNDPDSLQ